MPKPRWWRSLRWRMQAWHALILLAVVAGLGVALYVQLRVSRLDEIDSELLAAARVLEGVLRTVPPPVLRGEPGPPRRPPLEGRPDRPLGPPGPGEPRDDHPGPRRPPPGEPGPPRRGRPPSAYNPRASALQPVAWQVDEPDRAAGEEPPQSPPPRGRRFSPPGPGEPRRDDRGRGGPPPGGPMPGPPHEQWQWALTLPSSLVERHARCDTPPYFLVWLADERIWHRSTGRPSTIPGPQAVRSSRRAGQGAVRQRGPLREVILDGPEGTRVLVGRSIEAEWAGLTRLAWQLAATGVAVWALGLAGGWWLSTGALRPIREITSTAERISSVNLTERIKADELDTELAQLSEVLNGMLDRLEEAFRRQTQFTADASHELRTPLAVILSHVELALARPRSPDEYRESLQTCGQAARRLVSLVEDLLMLARVDAGGLELHRQPTDLRKLAEETRAWLAPQAAEREVCLVLEGDSAPVLADPDRLAQVLRNLLENAILYHRPGGQVTIATGREGATALATVSDNGPGIAPEDLARLFDRFYRADRSRTRVSGGSGLGLAIARGIVEAHGGRLTVRSQPGQGSEFRLELPAADDPSDQMVS